MNSYNISTLKDTNRITNSVFQTQKIQQSNQLVQKQIICQAQSTAKPNYIQKLARVVKEKSKQDLDRLFKNTERTRKNYGVIDELLTYWKLDESDSVLEELEEILIASDFGPATSSKIVNIIREQVISGKLKTSQDIKQQLGEVLVQIFKNVEQDNEQTQQDQSKKPQVILVVGVNGGGKTTSLGKLAHKFRQQDLQVMFIAGDTFRAASQQQLKVWADATQSQIYPDVGYNKQIDSLNVSKDQQVQQKEQQQKSSQQQQQQQQQQTQSKQQTSKTDSSDKGQRKRGKEKCLAAQVISEGLQQALRDQCPDVVLCDTSGRLHTDWRLMDELRECKKEIHNCVPGGPSEVLLVLDGTSGINMLNQAKEFKEAVNVSGIILTKLDGTSKGGAVVSVVDQLKLPVKFVGVGEKLEDIQNFNSHDFIQAIFPGFVSQQQVQQ